MTQPITEQLNDILTEYIQDLEDDVDRILEQNAQDCYTNVKADAPLNPEPIRKYKAGRKYWMMPGTYRSGFRVSIERGVGTVTYSVKNVKFPHLTHLLENGHIDADTGRRIPGQLHIDKNADKYAKKALTEIERMLKK